MKISKNKGIIYSFEYFRISPHLTSHYDFLHLYTTHSGPYFAKDETTLFRKISIDHVSSYLNHTVYRDWRFPMENAGKTGKSHNDGYGILNSLYPSFVDVIYLILEKQFS